MDKTELFSIFLFDIHCKQLNPYYGESNPDSWQDLVERSDSENEIDKTFFRTIARDIIQLQTDTDFESQLPRILYEVHASVLPPYYISFVDYLIYHNDLEGERSRNNWVNLAENDPDPERVDKKFFRDIAQFIVTNLKKDT